MKRVISALAGLAIAAVIVAPTFAAEKAAPAKDVTLTGEVIDLICYSAEGKGATGAKHADCAAKCIGEGGPVGLLLKDGTVFVLAAADHGDTKGQLLPFAAKTVKVTGKKMAKHGIKVFHFSKVEAAG